jgi:hypothetical protein
LDRRQRGRGGLPPPLPSPILNLQHIPPPPILPLPAPRSKKASVVEGSPRP